MGPEAGFVEALTAPDAGVSKRVMEDAIVSGVRPLSSDALLDGFLNGAARPGSR